MRTKKKKVAKHAKHAKDNNDNKLVLNDAVVLVLILLVGFVIALGYIIFIDHFNHLSDVNY